MDTKKVLIVSVFLTVFGFSFAQNPINQSFNTTKEFYVSMETTMGEMKILLYEDTPLHRENFVKLVKSGYYDSLLFHRVIKDFMIQGGDPNSRGAKPGAVLGNGSPGYRIPAEIKPNHFHKRGVLAAARDNNPQKASSGSQFYIVQGTVCSKIYLQNIERKMSKIFSEEQVKTYTTLGGSPWLDGDYTVFGEVFEGLDVLEKISEVHCGPNNRPVEDVMIISVKIVEI